MSFKDRFARFQPLLSELNSFLRNVWEFPKEKKIDKHLWKTYQMTSFAYIYRKTASFCPAKEFVVTGQSLSLTLEHQQECISFIYIPTKLEKEKCSIVYVHRLRVHNVFLGSDTTVLFAAAAIATAERWLLEFCGQMQGCKISVEQALMGCSESSTLDLRANVLEGLTGKQLDKCTLKNWVTRKKNQS